MERRSKRAGVRNVSCAGNGGSKWICAGSDGKENSDRGTKRTDHTDVYKLEEPFCSAESKSGDGKVLQEQPFISGRKMEVLMRQKDGCKWKN